MTSVPAASNPFLTFLLTARLSWDSSARKKLPLEAKDEIKSRIHTAEKFVPLDRLALSPQCGFASTMEGNLLSEADQEAKLRLVAETAREVWGDAKSPVSSKVKGEVRLIQLNLPPGPKGFPVLGSVFEPKGDTITYLTNCTREYGDIVFFRFLGVPACYVQASGSTSSPSLVTQNNNFVKSKDYRAMHAACWATACSSAKAISGACGQRKFIQPSISSGKNHGLRANHGGLHTQRMLETWSDGQTLDMHEAMMRLTLGIVAKTLFDADVSHEAEDVDAALAVLMGKFLRQAGMALLLPRWFPLPTSQLLKRAVGRLDKVIYGIIEQRRAGGQMSGDLLGAFLQTRDDEGIGMTDRQLHDEIMTLFLAGRGNDGKRAFLDVAPARPKSLKSNSKLIRGTLITVLNGKIPTPADLPRLVYSDMVLRESMRMYPPVWVIGRRALSAFRLGEYEIPANTNMLISQYLMHRDTRYFPEPERFDPERWRAGDPRAASLPRFAYFPFGGGPRVCIGAAFGMMEAVLLLATIAQKFKIEVAPGEKVSMQPSVTLRPRNGIPVKLKRR